MIQQAQQQLPQGRPLQLPLPLRPLPRAAARRHAPGSTRAVGAGQPQQPRQPGNEAGGHHLLPHALIKGKVVQQAQHAGQQEQQLAAATTAGVAAASLTAPAASLRGHRRCQCHQLAHHP